MKVLFFVLCFSLSAVALAGKDFNCFEGKIKIIDGKANKELVDSYCYDSILRKIFSSGVCKKNLKCMASIEKPLEVKMAEVDGPLNMLAEKVCKKFSGVDQKIEYWDGDHWIATNRCVFKDGSYIDSPTLVTKIKVTDAPKKEIKKEIKK